EGPIEDSRPPRFANVVGAIFLSAATVAYLVNLSTVGTALGLLVAALALLAATTGLCVGCEIYRFAARVRGVRAKRIDSVDLAELRASAGSGEIVVEFTHPLCTDCRSLEAELRASGRTVVTVDVSRRPELARKYGVVLVPTAVAVASSGAVVERLARPTRPRSRSSVASRWEWRLESASCKQRASSLDCRAKGSRSKVIRTTQPARPGPRGTFSVPRAPGLYGPSCGARSRSAGRGS